MTSTAGHADLVPVRHFCSDQFAAPPPLMARLGGVEARSGRPRLCHRNV